MKRELALPNGHIEVTKESAIDAAETGVMPFNIIPTNDQAAGQMQLLQEIQIIARFAFYKIDSMFSLSFFY